MRSLRANAIPAAAVAILIMSIFPVSAAPSTGVWTSLAPVPNVGGLGVEGMSVAAVGDNIVAAFGFDGGDTATTRIYNIPTDTWSFGSPGPGTNSEATAVTHRGLMYSIGGRLGGARSDLWRYDRSADAWQTRAPMPTARAGLAAAVVGDSIYAIGGRSVTGGPCGGGALAAVERYDVKTNSWTAVAPLLSARSDLAAATVDGKIYVFGGCTAGGGSIIGDVDVYDPVTNTWSAAPADLPTPRAAFYTVAGRGGVVYAIGGWDGVAPGLTTNEAYRPSTDSWLAGLPAMPTARAEHGAVARGKQIYVLGGAQPGFGASVAANESFLP